jgi:hypothetical protein
MLISLKVFHVGGRCAGCVTFLAPCNFSQNSDAVA